MNLCRACMINDRLNLHSLSGNNEILVLYNQFTSLNIKLSDGLPNFLCTSCIDKLNDFKVFKQKCHDSNYVLRENLIIKHEEKPEIKLNEFLDTNEVFDTLNDLVKNEDNHVNREANDILPPPSVAVDVDGPETSNTKSSSTEKNSDSSDNEGGDPPEDSHGRDSDEPSEIDSDEEWSRKYVAEAELAAKKKKKKYTFPYKCVRCERGFRYEERLLGHMREHEGHRAAVCEFCNREYTEWSGLQKHIYLCHKDEIKYICDCCGKKFIYESALETHKITHSGPRKHICETCGKAFSDLYQLNKHKLAHTDETPFECETCGKKFKSSQRLKTHQYRHTGIKKFVCQTCGKGFTTSPELRQHSIVHSDKKEFQCTLCQQVFKQRSQLSAHRRSHMF